MPTLGKLIADVRHRLSGVGAYTDAVSELQEDVNDTELVFRVDDASTGARRGMYEVGFEKIRVKAVDTTAATLTCYAFGRGYDGTSPAAHPAGSEVVHSPAFPASTIASEVNGVLHELYPSLYSVRQHEAQYTLTGFTIPAEAVGVVAVYRQGHGAEGWVRLDQWRFDANSGNGLWLKHIVQGETVRVVYAARPGVFNLTAPDADADFAAVTGLDDRVADLVALGVAYRLAPFIDLSRMVVAGAEARADAQAKPAGQGAALSRLLLAEFTARVQQEQMVLHKENPIRTHREW